MAATHPAAMTSDARFTHAITCPPADSYADGITTSTLGVPDLALARAQHAAYVDALAALGVAVTVLPPDAAFPDSTFVEDTVVVTARGAMLSRPGAASRMGEVAAIREALGVHVDDFAEIRHPGTLDGGDVCQAGGKFFIGLSSRTNVAGAEQLVGWLERRDFTATLLPIGGASPERSRGNPTLLHLKSGLGWLGDDRMVVVPSLARHPALQDYELIVVDADEAYAANCIRVNDGVILPAGFPRLAERIACCGYRVVPLEMSEFRKMDGGPSCLSVRVP